MLFCSTALAARIERAERDMLAESAAAIANRGRPGVYVGRLAGGVASFVGEGSPLNKLAGLGFAGPVDEGELEAVEHEFARRGSTLQVELSSLGDAGVAPLLTGRGYRLRGFENVLGLPLPPPVPPRSNADVEIDRSGPEELPAWLDVVVTGFLHADTQGVPAQESFGREILERDIGDTAVSAGFVRYLARRGGVPAGAASMRIGGGVAQLCGAATLPDQRRQGVQSSLLARRLTDALRAGCDVAVVTTQPGSKSQENVQRQGFALLYTRAILVRPPSGSPTVARYAASGGGDERPQPGGERARELEGCRHEAHGAPPTPPAQRRKR